MTRTASVLADAVGAGTLEVELATCWTCPADIIWVATEGGKRMPLDLEASAEGRFVFTGGIVVQFDRRGRRRETPVVRHVRESEVSGDHTNRRQSHFATCPDANQHRRPR